MAVKDKLITLEELGAATNFSNYTICPTPYNGNETIPMVLQGNRYSTTVNSLISSITPANIGAVSKAGDTMTGPLTIDPTNVSNRSLIFGTGNKGYIRLQSNNQFQFVQYNSAGSYYDNFNLPDSSGITADAGHSILTTKSPVTVQQGGTGASTAATARTNLGIATTVTTFTTSGINGNGNFNTGLKLSQHVIDAIYAMGVAITPYSAGGDQWWAHCVSPATGAAYTTDFSVTIRYHSIY